VDKGLASAEKETTQAISGFGQACDTTEALPGTIHLIARYQQDLETALIENIMAGGDSSARGILCGFILGIHNGLDAVPQNWLEEMTAFKQIKTLTGGL
jgi:ADP-ribosylglycohydrolase